MTDRTRIILEDLEEVRENLIALSHGHVKLTAHSAYREVKRGLILQWNLDPPSFLMRTVIR